MTLFLVIYEGGYLGGKALVFAETKEQAIEKVRGHRLTENFTEVSCYLVNPNDDDGVVYNDSGDY